MVYMQAPHIGMLQPCPFLGRKLWFSESHNKLQHRQMMVILHLNCTHIFLIEDGYDRHYCNFFNQQMNILRWQQLSLPHRRCHRNTMNNVSSDLQGFVQVQEHLDLDLECYLHYSPALCCFSQRFIIIFSLSAIISTSHEHGSTPLKKNLYELMSTKFTFNMIKFYRTRWFLITSCRDTLLTRK